MSLTVANEMTYLAPSHPRRPGAYPDWLRSSVEELINNVLTGGTEMYVGDEFVGDSIATRSSPLIPQGYHVSGLTVPIRNSTFLAGNSVVTLSGPIPTIAHCVPYPGPPHGNEAFLTVGAVTCAAHPFDFHSPRFKLFIQQIDHFQNLPDDWDGEGGIAPSWEAANAAKTFLAYLSDDKLPGECHAVGDGEIVLQWRRADSFIEVAFDGRTISWYARIGSEAFYSDDEFVSYNSTDHRLLGSINSLV